MALTAFTFLLIMTGLAIAISGQDKRFVAESKRHSDGISNDDPRAGTDNTNPTLFEEDPAIQLGILHHGRTTGGTSLFPNRALGTANNSFSLFAVGTVASGRKEDRQTSNLRSRIHKYINGHPGIHLRELRRCIGCAMGTLQYHLSLLEDEGIIKSIRVGNTRHFFPDGFSSKNQILRLTALARNPIIHSIVNECTSTNPVTRAELSRLLGIDVSIVSYYVSHLLNFEVLRTIRVFGREKPLMLTDWALESLI